MDYQMEELLPIVSELAQKYAGYESTSITYEKAQSLMEAVLFCLNEYNTSYMNTTSLVHKDIPVTEQYNIGVKLLYEKVENIRKILIRSPCNLKTLELSACMIRCRRVSRNSWNGTTLDFAPRIRS